MAGEEQNLMRGAKVSDSFEGSAAAAGIEVDEDIIEDDRQRIDMIGVFANKREAHR